MHVFQTSGHHQFKSAIILPWAALAKSVPLATGKSRGRGGARGQEGDRVELSLCSIDGGEREASRNEYEVIFHVFIHIVPHVLIYLVMLSFMFLCINYLSTC